MVKQITVYTLIDKLYSVGHTAVSDGPTVKLEAKFSVAINRDSTTAQLLI